jgi:sugar O-acyltransferase (sialic acid O-acetyltransferase NeuD family)
MLIVGAKGFAKEILEVCHQQNKTKNLVFFDDVNLDIPDFLYTDFQILKSLNEAQEYFNSVSNLFTIGIGNPLLRYQLYRKFSNIGGKFTSVISPYAHIGHFGNSIDDGCNIMTGSIITNDITINRGVLINLNCTVGHDCVLNEFVELSPGVSISGNCSIGSFSIIGTNATVLPKITIGENVVIGAGAVVTGDIPNNSLAVGIPAKVIKNLTPINFE